jgi:hypothetical protein
MRRASEGWQRCCGFGGTESALVRNSLVGLGLAACFSVNAGIAAAAEKPCPGVSVDIGTGMECGANTGAITANNLSSNQQQAKEERRKRIQERQRRGFAPDETEGPDSRDSTFESAFGALGYGARCPTCRRRAPNDDDRVEGSLWRTLSW